MEWLWSFKRHSLLRFMITFEIVFWVQHPHFPASNAGNVTSHQGCTVEQSTPLQFASLTLWSGVSLHEARSWQRPSMLISLFCDDQASAWALYCRCVMRCQLALTLLTRWMMCPTPSAIQWTVARRKRMRNGTVTLRSERIERQAAPVLHIVVCSIPSLREMYFVYYVILYLCVYGIHGIPHSPDKVEKMDRCSTWRRCMVTDIKKNHTARVIQE